VAVILFVFSLCAPDGFTVCGYCIKKLPQNLRFCARSKASRIGHADTAAFEDIRFSRLARISALRAVLTVLPSADIVSWKNTFVKRFFLLLTVIESIGALRFCAKCISQRLAKANSFVTVYKIAKIREKRLTRKEKYSIIQYG